MGGEEIEWVIKSESEFEMLFNEVLRFELSNFYLSII